MNKKDSRRKLLKSIAAGSGAVVAGKSLPESWSKPFVDSVVLPAHATTTDATETVPSGEWEGVLNFAGAPNANNSDSESSIGELIFDALIPPAYACVVGDIPFNLKISPPTIAFSPSTAVLSSSGPLGQTTVQGLKITLPKININGQLSNASATYMPSKNIWELVVEGLNNGFACKGNNARGLLILVKPTIVITPP